VRHSVPGAGLGILHEGTVTTACYGVADVRIGAPVTAATRFSAGSLTKSMVATVVAGLAAEGRLSLDDPVAGHVPELRASGTAGQWASRATLRDLLANRSGLPLSAGDLTRFTGRYAWPDRQVDVAATAGGLLISSEDGRAEALPLSDRAFLDDPADPDNPAVTFGAFDASGRPGVLYEMLWGLPRVS